MPECLFVIERRFREHVTVYYNTDSVCVCFITAGPITKLFAWGGRRWDP